MTRSTPRTLRVWGLALAVLATSATHPWTLLAQAYEFQGRAEDARRARAHIASQPAGTVTQMSAAALASHTMTAQHKDARLQGPMRIAIVVKGPQKFSSARSINR